jgi:hypothetical protein
MYIAALGSSHNSNASLIDTELSAAGHISEQRRLFVSSEQEICEPDDALRDVVHRIERAETDRAFAPIDRTLGVAAECYRGASE